ncbi:hypothetical protein [Streptomyces sp. NPDC096132]|uniref:hypothetical protein n=1 Tax=Streptomyces sp. NPDC096132 TaxID=3366075 RepID=UPI0038308274
MRARDAWQDESDRFGRVEGYDGERLPAPAPPNAVVTPRRNPGPVADLPVSRPAAPPSR